MPLQFVETALPGVIEIVPQVFKDQRGFFMEIFHQEKYENAGISKPFVQDNYSHSSRGTVRGLHYQLQNPQGKLVYVMAGEIFDVIVDIRLGSPTFGKWVSLSLSSDNRKQVFIPEGFAHGFCVISETADVMYKCTDLYAPGDDHGVLWSDPAIGIDWPVKEPTLSDKDMKYLRLSETPQDRLPVYSP